jgi:hypothetical protein
MKLCPNWLVGRAVSRSTVPAPAPRKTDRSSVRLTAPTLASLSVGVAHPRLRHLGLAAAIVVLVTFLAGAVLGALASPTALPTSPEAPASVTSVDSSNSDGVQKAVTRVRPTDRRGALASPARLTPAPRGCSEKAS